VTIRAPEGALREFYQPNGAGDSPAEEE